MESLINEVLNTVVLKLSQITRRAAFIKSAYSVQDLLQDTSKKSVKYVDGCEAALVKATPKNGRWIFKVKCGAKWSKGPYKVRFRILKGERGSDMNTRDVEISCNCNAWRYNGADFNSKSKDYQEREYSNGEAPNIRDRRRKYLICKHVAASIPIFSEFIVPQPYRHGQGTER